MATPFYTHYVAEHKDCKVYIEGRTQQLLSAEVAMLGDECLMLERSATDLFEPVFSAGVSVVLESRSNYQFAPLMTAPDRSYRLRVEKGGREVFRGWVANELYEEEYEQPPYPVVVRASDGLASLEDYQLDVEALPIANESYPELVTLADLVEGCLARTGLELPVVYCSTLRAEDGGGGREMLATLAVDRNALFNDDDGVRKAEPAAETLTHILQSFGMRVYQDCGRWVVERYTDRANAPEGVTDLDTDANPFVDTPTLSVSAGYGSQVANLNVDTFDSVFHTDMRMPMPELEDISYETPPYKWHRRKSPATILNAKDKGYSLLVPNNDRTATVFCSAPIRLRKGDKVGVSLKVKCRGDANPDSPNSAGESKRQCYIPIEVYLISPQGSVVAEANAFDLKSVPALNLLAPVAPSHGDFAFVPPVDFVPGMQVIDYRKYAAAHAPWYYRHPIVSEKDLMTKGANISYTIGETTYAPGANCMQQGSSIVIVINSRVRAFEPGGDPRPYDVVVPRNWDWQVGSLEVSIDTSADDPVDTLTGALDGGYLREAPELDLHLRMDSAQLPIDYTYRGALFVANTGRLATGIYSNDVLQPLEQALLSDNFAQYARRRDRFSATLRRDDVPSPATIFTLSTRPGHRYMLTGCTTDLLEGESAITLEEINPAEITPTWQSSN